MNSLSLSAVNEQAYLWGSFCMPMRSLALLHETDHFGTCSSHTRDSYANKKIKARVPGEKEHNR